MIDTVIESMKSLRGRAMGISAGLAESDSLGADKALDRAVSEQIDRIAKGLRNWEMRLTGSAADVEADEAPLYPLAVVIEFCGDMREMMVAAGYAADALNAQTDGDAVNPLADNLNHLASGFPGYIDRIDQLLGVRRKVSPEPVPEAKPGPDGYRFAPAFLKSEAVGDETLLAVDARLLAEFTDLEGLRPLSDAKEARRIQLHSNFYTYKG